MTDDVKEFVGASPKGLNWMVVERKKGIRHWLDAPTLYYTNIQNIQIQLYDEPLRRVWIYVDGKRFCMVPRILGNYPEGPAQFVYRVVKGLTLICLALNGTWPKQSFPLTGNN